MSGVSESIVEDAALDWLERVGMLRTVLTLRQIHLLPSVPITGRWSWNGGCGMPWPNSTPMPGDVLDDAFRS